MAKIEPKRFAVENRDGHVRVADVVLHQDIRSDRDGLARQYLQVSGRVMPELDDFEKIDIRLKVEVYDDDECLGTLSPGELTIKSEDEPAVFEGKDALEVAVSARVTRIVIAIDATVVSTSTGKAELLPEA